MANNSVVTQADLVTFYNTYVKPYLNGENISPSLAPIESTSTAVGSYSVGERIVFNNQLCEVTDDIAVGDTIAIGTNVDYTDVDEQLTKINSDLGKAWTIFDTVTYNNTFADLGDIGDASEIKFISMYSEAAESHKLNEITLTIADIITMGLISSSYYGSIYTISGQGNHLFYLFNNHLYLYNGINNSQCYVYTR